MRRILIVDDSKVMQRLVGGLLEETGADLAFASSAEEALYAFRQDRPDVIVSDIQMGGMTGVELAQRVRRESGGRTRVVLMSAGDLENGRSAVQRGEADVFLPKPLDGEELRRLVSGLLPPPTDTDMQRRALRRLRVLLADDTEVGRRMMQRLLRADPEIEVVGVVSDGSAAVEAAERLKPGLVLLDAVMPGLDGVSATREIMKRAPVPVVLITPKLASPVASVAFEATQAGAVDFLTPPDFGDVDGPEARTFRQKLKDLAQVRVIRRRPATPLGNLRPSTPSSTPSWDIGVIAICGSTGGPATLARLLSRLAPALPYVPVLVVQHILSGFAASFADWLEEASGVPIRVAREGDAVLAGRALVAPDTHHLLVASRDRVVVSDEAPVGAHRPSGTLLFESAARVFGSELCAVVLTGMGEDGVRGLATVREHGGLVVVQSPDTCVVPGMPEAAIRAGLADATLAPDAIAERIVSSVLSKRGASQ